MKKGAIILISALLLFILGCGSFSFKSTDDSALSGNSSDENHSAVVSGATESQNTGSSDQEMVPQTTDVDSASSSAINNTPALNKSGSLELQTDLSLCPHLARDFECDKYDIRRCSFATSVGENGFYPDYINCRSGKSYENENPEHKYCVIQECRPIQKGNVVYAYGGPIMFAEYYYSVDKVEGGINTHYLLYRCGEDYMEFSSEFECQVYRTEAGIYN